MKILVIHGAGMNMRGKAQVEIFGPMTLPEYDAGIRAYAQELGVEVEIFHSNIEGEVINRLFAPPLGLGLYGACLIGKVPIEETVKPILGYLGLLFLCLLVIAFVPSISTWLPHAMGYGK